jgi:hypothetical protein
LLTFTDYEFLAKATRQTFPGSILSKSPLAIPSDGCARRDSIVQSIEISRVCDELLRSPQDILYDGKNRYILGFKLPDGSIGTRDAYINAMLVSEQAVADNESGIVWIYPITEVNFEPNDELITMSDGHASADLTAVIGTLLTVELLHHANGTGYRDSSSIIANEAVYRIGEDGRSAEICGVITLGWDFYTDRIAVKCLNPEFTSSARIRPGAILSGL